MPVKIEITADTAEAVRAELRVLLFGLPESASAPAASTPEPPRGDTVPTLEPHQSDTEPTPEPDEAEAIQREAMANPAPHRRRGRPRKAEAPEGWEVRRYGGNVDDRFDTQRAAVGRLIELIHNAGDTDALDALIDANADLISRLDTEWRAQVQDAAENIRPMLMPGRPAEGPPVPAEPPAPQARYFDVEGKPIYSITPDARGSRVAVRAVATGPQPTLGHKVAVALLNRHGIGKLSELSDDDPLHGKIAREAAALLGLPVASATPPEPSGLDRLFS